MFLVYPLCPSISRFSDFFVFTPTKPFYTISSWESRNYRSDGLTVSRPLYACTEKTWIDILDRTEEEERKDEEEGKKMGKRKRFPIIETSCSGIPFQTPLFSRLELWTGLWSLHGLQSFHWKLFAIVPLVLVDGMSIYLEN